MKVGIVENNKDEFIRDLHSKVPMVLEKIGLVAEGYAKRLCAVDTGLLRNSITHALDGEPAAISGYRASRGSNRTKKGNRVSATSKNAGSVGVGFYSGNAPEESNDHKRTVYIGTNVEYAPYVELGTSRTRAQPFLKPAIMDHLRVYESILKEAMNK